MEKEPTGVEKFAAKIADKQDNPTMHELAKAFPEKSYRELEIYRDADRQEEAQQIPLTESQKKQDALEPIQEEAQQILIKDHNKLWKPRYLLITLEYNYKLGYCDEETLSKVDVYVQTVHDKINNLSKHKNNSIKPMNEVWEDSDYVTYKTQTKSLKAYIKKRKIMQLKACCVIKTFKQYKGDVYKKNLLCTKIIEPII